MSAESTTQIDAAVEQVVRSTSDPVALETSVRELAGLLGFELAAKQPEPAAMLVHANFGGHYEQHGGRDEYVTPCGTVGAANLTSLWNFISCDGCVKALIDNGLGGTDATLQSAPGEHGTCVCGGGIRYFTCHGGHWIHDEHPADGHDAVLGGPA